MSQTFLRHCIKSPRAVQYHRRWFTQQTITHNVPVTSSNGNGTTDTAQSVATPTASSSKSTPASKKQKASSKVDAFLASLQTTGSQPSLGDLESNRPHGHAHPESTLYAKQYNGLLQNLGRSFSKEQLRHFGEQYQLKSQHWRSGKRKTDYARAIVENAWGWPPLREIEKTKRERTEIVTESKEICHTPSRLNH